MDFVYPSIMYSPSKAAVVLLIWSRRTHQLVGHPANGK